MSEEDKTEGIEADDPRLGNVGRGKRNRSGLSTGRAVKCSAHKKNGDPCGNWPIRGASVCGFHGGRAPAVKRAAKVRLLMASDWAVGELVKIASSASDERTRLAALNSVLDRAGISAKQEVEVTVPRFEVLLSGISRSRAGRKAAPVPDPEPEAEADGIVDAEIIDPDDDPMPRGVNDPTGVVVQLPARGAAIQYRSDVEKENRNSGYVSDEEMFGPPPTPRRSGRTPKGRGTGSGMTR